MDKDWSVESSLETEVVLLRDKVAELEKQLRTARWMRDAWKDIARKWKRQCRYTPMSMSDLQGLASHD